jgi:hypothetical protein
MNKTVVDNGETLVGLNMNSPLEKAVLVLIE